MDVNGISALVTGAGSGLGAATARALAKAGAKVALLDINLTASVKVAGEIGGVAIRCYVSDGLNVEAAFQDARDLHGAARIVVNCAGIAKRARNVVRNGPHDLESFTRAIQVNLIGTFNIMRLAAADMQTLEALETGERGLIVNTASIAAFEGQIGQAAYSASKGGVAAMTLPAARELAKTGIRVLAIAPELFGTPMLFGLPDEVQENLGALVAFPPRLGDPDEYAKLVMHMANNVMLNGEVVHLDGAICLSPI